MLIPYMPIIPCLKRYYIIYCVAKLYQYAKNATFAPHFHTNFNKTWKRIYTSIPIIIL